MTSNEKDIHNPEVKKPLDDNARKFLVTPISPDFLIDNQASSFVLIVDWLETNEDNEKKIAFKQFDNGDSQILLISKVTVDGNRTSVKEPISAEEYKKLTASSVLHLEKRRYKLDYVQSGVAYSLKYDEFSDKKLCVLEVDGSDEDTRNAFEPSDFPASLDEVTGDMKYSGYRVAHVIEAL